MTRKIGMVSLGCSKNQVDGELMLALLSKEGYEISPDPNDCDAIIINTCGFIEDAKKESIDNILEFCDMKGNGRLKAVAVTGCLAERYKNEVAKEIPEVDVVLGIGKNSDIVSAIHKALEGEKVLDFAAKEDHSMEGDRILANPGYYAYIKIADGCDNCCSYCAIPLIRGNFRSREMDNILEEVKTLAKRGVVEFNLVAQDSTRYGEDLYGKVMLPELIKKVCAMEEVKWVRILYCYPERITDELLQVMAEENKVVKYMDIPVQHASGRILNLMNRRGDKEALIELMAKIRRYMPDIALRTTMITGFPGETNDDFTQMCELVEQVKFERLGVFTYSAEEDTPAYDMEDQIDAEVKLRRKEIIMEIQSGIAQNIAASLVNSVLTVLVDGYDSENGIYTGRSYMDAPDIDTKVYFTAQSQYKNGDFVNVAITGSEGFDLIGEEVAK